jgi:hypothetical protein
VSEALLTVGCRLAATGSPTYNGYTGAAITVTAVGRAVQLGALASPVQEGKWYVHRRCRMGGAMKQVWERK